jgi:Domain of unknown function (DUF1840)
MIYKFKSAASGDVLMLGANGDELLRVLGREPAAKGIIEVEVMANAIAQIQAAIAAESTSTKGRAGGDDDAAAALGLRQRLWPMLQMLERSLAEKVPVVWGV